MLSSTPTLPTQNKMLRGAPLARITASSQLEIMLAWSSRDLRNHGRLYCYNILARWGHPSPEQTTRTLWEFGLGWHSCFWSQKGLTKPKSRTNHQRIFWTIRGGYRSWPSKTEGFEANRTRKFTRTFGKIFVTQFLCGTFAVPNCCCGFQPTPGSAPRIAPRMGFTWFARFQVRSGRRNMFCELFIVCDRNLFVELLDDLYVDNEDLEGEFKDDSSNSPGHTRNLAKGVWQKATNKWPNGKPKMTQETSGILTKQKESSRTPLLTFCSTLTHDTKLPTRVWDHVQ